MTRLFSLCFCPGDLVLQELENKKEENARLTKELNRLRSEMDAQNKTKAKKHDVEQASEDIE